MSTKLLTSIPGRAYAVAHGRFFPAARGRYHHGLRRNPGHAVCGPVLRPSPDARRGPRICRHVACWQTILAGRPGPGLALARLGCPANAEPKRIGNRVE